MIFTGDIALPSFSIKLPNSLPQGRVWIGNLEGSIIEENRSNENGVYNSFDAIKKLICYIPFKAFNLANNHLLDFASVSHSVNLLHNLGVSTVGVGNYDDASQSLVVEDDDQIAYRILAFGWENIQCPVAEKNKEGVNPLTRKHVLECAREALNNPEPVICFMHWDYELEQYPMPSDRSLSHELIDMGVSAIVGCHCHRIQQIEFYKERPIVYGMGNFLFRQGAYFNGKLKYPLLSSEEWVFEIKGNSVFILHRFEYDNINHELKYIGDIFLTPKDSFYGKAVYNDYNDEEYLKFFKKNRNVKKILPIFTHNESAVSYWMKSKWIKIRGWLLDTSLSLNLKSANRR